MNLSDFIGPAAAGFLGFVGGYVALDKRQAVAEARMDERMKATEKTLTEMKAEHMRSAADQGTRLEELRDDVGTLEDFKARVEGAQQNQRDMSGVVQR